jgi:hypothetical protein
MLLSDFIKLRSFLCEETDARAKYYNFWQGDFSKLVYTFQRLTMAVLIALAIAAGVEGSNYNTPSDVAVGQQLAQAYGVICISAEDSADGRYLPSLGERDPMGCIVDEKEYGE